MMEFEKAVQVLCDAGVEFVIIGGVAATFHGSTRVTYDLDICYARSAANVQRLATALAPFRPRPRGFPQDLPFLWDERSLRNTTVLTLQTSIGEIDLLAEVAGVGIYEQVKAKSVLVDAFERKVHAIDLKALIQAKRAADREKDRSALPELESLLEANEGE
jgi:predicted nucleotidyltransferase